LSICCSSCLEFRSVISTILRFQVVIFTFLVSWTNCAISKSCLRVLFTSAPFRSNGCRSNRPAWRCWVTVH
jgi:hypothetical protein